MVAGMNDHALIEHIRQSVPDLIALYRFGSQTKGTARPDSDVELAQELATQLHRDVDLVDLRTASAVMRMQVISTGECLDAPNEPARREFEMYAYSDYARLNEERKGILDDIRARGSVYTD